MINFAKIFNSKKFGQILVKHDQSDEPGKGAEIRFYFVPDGLGVCSIAIQYPDDVASWDTSEEVFNAIGKEQAESIVKETYTNFSTPFATKDNDDD